MIPERERHLQLKALALAIAAIDAAPPERQPGSDRKDMADMLDALAPSDMELEMYARNAAWIISGADPYPPEMMEKLRAMQDDLERRQRGEGKEG